MINSFLVQPGDDVAVVTKSILKGENVTYLFDGQEVTIKAMDDIPVYHKIAVKSVKRGEYVLKYGEVIGCAIADIKTGNHVHTQNLSDLVIKAGESI